MSYVRLFGPSVWVAMRRGKHRVVLFGETHSPSRPETIPPAAFLFPDALFHTVAKHAPAWGDKITFVFEATPPDPRLSASEFDRRSLRMARYNMQNEHIKREYFKNFLSEIDFTGVSKDRMKVLDRLNDLAHFLVHQPNVRVVFGDNRRNQNMPGIDDPQLASMIGVSSDPVDKQMLVDFLEKGGAYDPRRTNARVREAAFADAHQNARLLHDGDDEDFFQVNNRAFDRAVMLSDAPVIKHLCDDTWSDLSILYFGLIHIAHIITWLFRSGFHVERVSFGNKTGDHTFSEDSVTHKTREEWRAEFLSQNLLDALKFDDIFKAVTPCLTSLQAMGHDGVEGGLPTPLDLFRSPIKASSAASFVRNVIAADQKSEDIADSIARFGRKLRRETLEP